MSDSGECAPTVAIHGPGTEVESQPADMDAERQRSGENYNSQQSNNEIASQLPFMKEADERVILWQEFNSLDVLNSESVFDFHRLESEKAVCIKAPIRFYDMKDEQFQVLLSAFQGQIVAVDKEDCKFGKATLLEPNEKAFSVESFNSGTSLFKFSKGLLETTYRPIMEELDLEQWFHVGGPLPAVIPNYEGISSPHFIFSVAGTRVPLHRENWNLGAVNFVAKGRKKWLLIPPERTNDVHSFLKAYLLEQECDVMAVDECEHFLQHKNLYFDPDFLKEKLDAIEVIQEAGEVLLVYPGIFHQLENEGSGMAIAYNSAPTYWCKVIIEDDCKCPNFATSDKDEMDIVRSIKDTVCRFNHHLVSVMGLLIRANWKVNVTLEELPGRYEQTLKDQTTTADVQQQKNEIVKHKKGRGKKGKSKASIRASAIQPSPILRIRRKAMESEQEDGNKPNSSLAIPADPQKKNIITNLLNTNDVSSTGSYSMSDQKEDRPNSTNSDDLPTAPISSTLAILPSVNNFLEANASTAIVDFSSRSEEMRKKFLKRCIDDLTPLISRHFSDVLRESSSDLQIVALNDDNDDVRSKTNPTKRATKKRSTSPDRDLEPVVPAKRFGCCKCGKLFARGDNRKKHELVCKGKNEIKCPECDSTFLGNAGFVAHMKIHGK